MTTQPDINLGGNVSATKEHTVGRHYVYQRVNVLNNKALHLNDHLRIAARSFEQIYGFDPAIDERETADRIVDLIRTVRHRARSGSIVMLCFTPQGDNDCHIAVEYERPLLEAGYTLSPLRPKAATFEYSIPFGSFPTNFALEAQDLFDTLALSRHGAGRSVRCEGAGLLSCGNSPIFACRGRVLITPPLTQGAPTGVERDLVIDAASKLRFGVREEPILHSELKSFDELFLADASGITSLAECDGAKFMSLAAARIAIEWKVES